jgi:hypothetical protein
VGDGGDRGAVAADHDALAVADAEVLGVGGGELDALLGCRNFSAGDAATSGAAQIERNVPSRRRAVRAASPSQGAPGRSSAGSTARPQEPLLLGLRARPRRVPRPPTSAGPSAPIASTVSPA